MLEPLSETRRNRVYLTEILHPADPRRNCPQFLAAKRKEIEGLQKRGTQKVVLKEEVDPKASILNGRFVLTIKNAISDGEVYKARYVAQGHRDKDKTISSRTRQHLSKVSSSQPLQLQLYSDSMFGVMTSPKLIFKAVKNL